MDNLCHTLAGAALGEAGLKSRTTRAMATLMIASNLPDIDVGVFATDTLAMSFRRGWTHGVLAMVALPAALASAAWLWDRWRGYKLTEEEASAKVYGNDLPNGRLILENRRPADITLEIALA